MSQHQWVRHKFISSGQWEGQQTCLQVWKCKKCKMERPRPDDNSTPSHFNCLGT